MIQVVWITKIQQVIFIHEVNYPMVFHKHLYSWFGRLETTLHIKITDIVKRQLYKKMSYSLCYPSLVTMERVILETNVTFKGHFEALHTVQRSSCRFSITYVISVSLAAHYQTPPLTHVKYSRECVLLPWVISFLLILMFFLGQNTFFDYAINIKRMYNSLIV